MKFELLNACTELIAAVANGLYQGIILTLLVWLGLRVVGRTNAATRHAVWFLALLLVSMIIPAHWANSQRQRSAQAAMAASVGGFQSEGPMPAALAIPGTRLPAPGDFFPSPPTDFLPLQPGDHGVNRFLGGSPGSDGMRDELQDVRAAGLEMGPTRLGSTGVSGPAAHLRDLAAFNHKVNWRRWFEPVALDVTTGSSWLGWASLALVATWLVAAGFKVALLIWRLFQLRKLKRDAFPPNGPLATLFEELRRALGIRRRAELKVSLTHHSPLLLGFCHPVVLLGKDDAQPTELAEHVLRHELAHLRRYDDWVNLFQRLVQSLLPFHPAVWWISRQLSLEREITCDDWVLQHGRRPRAYALLLADLAARFQSSPPLLAPGALTNNSQLKQRISMILNTRRNTSPRLAKARLGFISVVAALLALLAFYSAPRLVLAQTVSAPSGPAAAGGSATISAVSAAGAETIVAADPTEAPDVEFGDEVSADPEPPGDIAPGPKAKPLSPGEHAPALAPVPPIPPKTPSPVIKFAPPLPPRIVATTPRLFALGQPSAGADGSSDRSSIEQRLVRLEKMVESLLAQQGSARDRDSSLWKLRNENENDQNNKSARAQQERAAAQADRARAQADRAAEQMKLAAEDLKRVAKDGELKKRDEWRAQLALKSGPDQELQALRKAREALGRELEHLDRQIERLEQQRGRLDQATPSPDGKHIDQPVPEAPVKERRT